MAVWQLDDELWFPNPRWGEDDGLVAIGGDLSVERLVLAYSNGFFPPNFIILVTPPVLRYGSQLIMPKAAGSLEVSMVSL